MADESRLTVRLTPRGGRDAIEGWAERPGEAVLRVRVAAPPVEGRANEALLRLLAAALDVPRGRLRLARGETGREKTIAVAGLSDAVLRTRLTAALSPRDGRNR